MKPTEVRPNHSCSGLFELGRQPRLPSSKRTAVRRLPGTIRCAVWAGQYHYVTVEVTKPDLPVVRTSIALGRIPVASQDNLRPEFLSPDHGRIEVLHFKPQQHPIPMNQFRIPDWPVMMINLPAVQLHQQLTIRHQLLVMTSTVAALTSQQSLVPATARFNVPDTNEGLWTHLHRSQLLLRLALKQFDKELVEPFCWRINKHGANLRLAHATIKLITLTTPEALAAVQTFVAGAVADGDVAAVWTGRRIGLEMGH